MSTTAAWFDTEYRAFERVRGHLVHEHEGEFAVIVGEELLGVFPTAVAAFEAGVRIAGPDRPFLLERIQDREPPAQLPAYVHGLHATASW